MVNSLVYIVSSKKFIYSEIIRLEQIVLKSNLYIYTHIYRLTTQVIIHSALTK